MNPDPALLADDRSRVLQLAALPAPDELALIDAARLLMRYSLEGFGSDLHHQLQAVIKHWGLTRLQLHERTRALWASGWRPRQDPAQQLDGVSIGSGADVGG
jgi:hypothetical protein